MTSSVYKFFLKTELSPVPSSSDPVIGQLLLIISYCCLQLSVVVWFSIFYSLSAHLLLALFIPLLSFYYISFSHTNCTWPMTEPIHLPFSTSPLHCTWCSSTLSTCVLLPVFFNYIFFPPFPMCVCMPTPGRFRAQKRERLLVKYKLVILIVTVIDSAWCLGETKETNQYKGG